MALAWVRPSNAGAEALAGGGPLSLGTLCTNLRITPVAAAPMKITASTPTSQAHGRRPPGLTPGSRIW